MIQSKWMHKLMKTCNSLRTSCTFVSDTNNVNTCSFSNFICRGSAGLMKKLFRKGSNAFWNKIPRNWDVSKSTCAHHVGCALNCVQLSIFKWTMNGRERLPYLLRSDHAVQWSLSPRFHFLFVWLVSKYLDYTYDTERPFNLMRGLALFRRTSQLFVQKLDSSCPTPFKLTWELKRALETHFYGPKQSRITSLTIISWHFAVIGTTRHQLQETFDWPTGFAVQIVVMFTKTMLWTSRGPLNNRTSAFEINGSWHEGAQW